MNILYMVNFDALVFCQCCNLFFFFLFLLLERDTNVFCTVTVSFVLNQTGTIGQSFGKFTTVYLFSPTIFAFKI